MALPSFAKFVRTFTFTHWHAPNKEYLAGLTDALGTAYYCISREIGEKEGGVHYHGYVELIKKRRFTALGKHFGCHIDPIEKHPKTGDPMYHEAVNYTKKDGDFIEKGTPPTEIDRTTKKKEDKFVECIRLAKKGLLKKLERNYPTMFVLHLSKWLQIGELNNTTQKSTTRTCLWLWGKSGVGKSRWAFEHYPQAYRKNPNNEYFQRYDRQKVIVIDDLGPEHRKVWGHSILQISDRYPFLANKKYGSVPTSHEMLIITSNYPLADVFPWNHGDINPWQRRFHEFEVAGYIQGDNNEKGDLILKGFERPDPFDKDFYSLNYKLNIIMFSGDGSPKI